MTSDLYYEVCRSYHDSPDLQYVWLKNLTELHKKNQNWQEVAQTTLVAANLVAQRLKTMEMGIPQSKDRFISVCPNIMQEKDLPNFDNPEEEGIFQGKAFTLEGYLTLLQDTIYALKRAQMYELCIEVYNLLIEVYQARREYNKMGRCFLDLKHVCSLLVAVVKDKSRLFGNYYRVGFFGPKWGEIKGKSFIYKESPTTRIGDIRSRLQEQYENKFGKDKVELLPNQEVDESKLDANKYFYQIASVTEYCISVDENDSLFERQFGIDTFIFETPFTKSGKAQSNDMSEQYRRRTILKTKQKFPGVTKRSLVIDRKTIELTPIEVAIDLLQNRNKVAKQECEEPINLKTLQQVLQGSVLAQVNAGPLEIANVFLKKKL
eukprot:TRINITY_DN8081_c0_g1_i1.p1 TRINITY_DN8081_c0_g1~~TRINITY_DN8081_c0_g1_i1.p1  ORF type:complete len:395 (-),score=74.81 TRINITY_DN8081_c0_g1_i1:416-1546(-)